MLRAGLGEGDDERHRVVRLLGEEGRLASALVGGSPLAAGRETGGLGLLVRQVALAGGGGATGHGLGLGLDVGLGRVGRVQLGAGQGELLVSQQGGLRIPAHGGDALVGQPEDAFPVVEPLHGFGRLFQRDEHEGEVAVAGVDGGVGDESPGSFQALVVVGRRSADGQADELSVGVTTDLAVNVVIAAEPLRVHGHGDLPLVYCDG
mgnify:CR=1 FL=1